MSCLAAQVNIQNIALNRLLGKDIDWKIDRGGWSPILSCLRLFDR